MFILYVIRKSRQKRKKGVKYKKTVKWSKKSNMKIDRLIGILSVLLQKNKTTATELSEKFEVSRRTINRDIDDLCKAGIPIITIQGKGGGISIMDNYKIDRTLITSSEMMAILTGLQSLDSVSGTNSYRTLMEKLSVDNTVSDNHIIIDLSYWDKSAVESKIELIKLAIENRKKITFTYHSPTEETKRIIEPYHLIFQWANWYVWGFCTIRKDYRMFKLTRMTNLKFINEKYDARAIPPYICDKMCHTNSEIKTIVKFLPDVKWRIIDEFGINSFKENEDGSITMTFTWSDVPALYRYILTFGESAEILEPKEYREEFVSTLKNILEKYKT